MFHIRMKYDQLGHLSVLPSDCINTVCVVLLFKIGRCEVITLLRVMGDVWRHLPKKFPIHWFVILCLCFRTSSIWQNFGVSVCCIMAFSEVCAYEFVGINFISIHILCISFNWYLHHVLHFREEINVTIHFTQRCFISKYYNLAVWKIENTVKFKVLVGSESLRLLEVG
jgi:hypothetical protein